eukprot:gene6557-7857_t
MTRKEAEKTLMRKCESVLRKIQQHSKAAIFHKPVDIHKTGALDYYKIITNPMDMQTIRNNFKEKYTCPSDFIADMRLMFQNCKIYNAVDSDVWKLGNHVEEAFDKELKASQVEEKWRASASLPDVIPAVVPPAPPPARPSAPPPAPSMGGHEDAERRRKEEKKAEKAAKKAALLAQLEENRKAQEKADAKKRALELAPKTLPPASPGPSSGPAPSDSAGKRVTRERNLPAKYSPPVESPATSERKPKPSSSAGKKSSSMNKNGKRPREGEVVPEPAKWEAQDWFVRCKCGLTYDDGGDMVECSGCKAWQHYSCNNIMPGAPVADDWKCSDCRSGKRHKGGPSRGGTGGERDVMMHEMKKMQQDLVELTKNASMGAGRKAAPKIVDRNELATMLEQLPDDKLIGYLGKCGVDTNKLTDEEVELDLMQLDEATLFKLHKFAKQHLNNAQRKADRLASGLPAMSGGTAAASEGTPAASEMTQGGTSGGGGDAEVTTPAPARQTADRPEPVAEVAQPSVQPERPSDKPPQEAKKPAASAAKPAASNSSGSDSDGSSSSSSDSDGSDSDKDGSDGDSGGGSVGAGAGAVSTKISGTTANHGFFNKSSGVKIERVENAASWDLLKVQAPAEPSGDSGATAKAADVPSSSKEEQKEAVSGLQEEFKHFNREHQRRNESQRKQDENAAAARKEVEQRRRDAEAAEAAARKAQQEKEEERQREAERERDKRRAAAQAELEETENAGVAEMESDRALVNQFEQKELGTSAAALQSRFGLTFKAVEEPSTSPRRPETSPPTREINGKGHAEDEEMRDAGEESEVEEGE